MSAATTLTPASIIVASWREKTCSDFGLTFLNRPRAASPLARALDEVLRQQPARPQLLARRADVGGVDLAAESEALGVDCVVCECGHFCFSLCHRLAQPVA